METIAPFVDMLGKLEHIEHIELPRYEVIKGGVAPDEYWESMLERHKEIEKSMSAQTASVKETGMKMVSDLEEVARETKQPPPGIDALIDRLLKFENKKKLALDEPEDDYSVYLKDLPRPRRRRIARILKTSSDLTRKSIKDALKMMRDVRWALIALRAEYEDPGDAPVFDDPADLASYLQAATSGGIDQN